MPGSVSEEIDRLRIRVAQSKQSSIQISSFHPNPATLQLSSGPINKESDCLIFLSYKQQNMAAAMRSDLGGAGSAAGSDVRDLLRQEGAATTASDNPKQISSQILVKVGKHTDNQVGLYQNVKIEEIFNDPTNVLLFQNCFYGPALSYRQPQTEHLRF